MGSGITFDIYIHNMRDAGRARLAAASYAVLPPVLCFAFAWTPAAPLFRPFPVNSFYDGMLVAVCVSVSITEALLQRSSSGGVTISSSRATAKPGDALIVFEVLLALLLGVLYLFAGAPASGATWLLLSAVLFFAAAACSRSPLMAPTVQQPIQASTSQPAPLAAIQIDDTCRVPEQRHSDDVFQQQLQWRWSFCSDRTPLVWGFSGFLCLAAVLFLAFPVFQQWSGPPEPFVRWVPYSPAGELIWRGVFASYAGELYL